MPFRDNLNGKCSQVNKVLLKMGMKTVSSMRTTKVLSFGNIAIVVVSI